MWDPELKTRWDNYSVLKTARDEGFEEGYEIGFSVIAAMREVEIAKKMKENNISTERIAAIIGLTKEQVEKL